MRRSLPIRSSSVTSGGDLAMLGTGLRLIMLVMYAEYATVVCSSNCKW